MRRWLSHCKKLRAAEDGVAYLEFALSLPVLLGLFLGSVELTRYMSIMQKVEKSSVTVTDVVAQSSTINTTQLGQLVEAVQQVMLPYSFGVDGYVIISSVSKTGTNPARLNWQYTGGGTWTHASQIGTTGGIAALPNSLTLNDRDTVIIAEIYYHYHPLFGNVVFPGGTIYKVAVFRPRLGDLTRLS